MNNNLIKIQEMLMNQMERLDTLDSRVGVNRQEEIARGNFLSQNAVTFLKSVNIGIRVIEMSHKFEMSKNTLHKELGIENEK